MAQEDDDRPWTEEQWERFMKRSDLRSARFGELMETLMDEPDRHAQLAREMGWEHEEEPPPGYDAPHFEAEEHWAAAALRGARAPLYTESCYSGVPYCEQDNDPKPAAHEFPKPCGDLAAA